MSDSVYPRVAHIVIALHHGGLEQCALRWCMERNRSHSRSTMIICLDEPGELATLLPPDSCFSLRANRERFPWDFAAVRRLKELVSAQKIDVLHSHNTAARQYAALAGARLTVKHVYTDHASNLYLGGVVNRLRLAYMRRHTDVCVAVSRQAAENLARAERTNPDNIRVVLNGVDGVALRAAANRLALRREFGWRDDELLIGFVGRLSREKGVDRLIKAFAAMRTRMEGCLILVGDGGCREELERQAEACGVAGRVVFLGLRGDAARLMAAFDLFVLPSRSEGLPLALLEAMALGIPVAVTQVGACPEVVGNGEYGEILPDDESTWPDVLTRLLQEAGRGSPAITTRTAAAARRVDSVYSLAASLASYEKIYGGDG